MKKHEAPIQRITESFSATLDSEIARIQRETIIPFCDKHGYRFIAGMGTWNFTHKTRESIGGWNSDELPARILSTLRIEYPLNRGQDIGSMMPDYTPPNF